MRAGMTINGRRRREGRASLPSGVGSVTAGAGGGTAVDDVGAEATAGTDDAMVRFNAMASLFGVGAGASSSTKSMVSMGTLGSTWPSRFEWASNGNNSVATDDDDGGPSARRSSVVAGTA